MTFSDLKLLVGRSFTRPREVARILIAMRMTPDARWTAFALVVVLSALLSMLVETVTRVGIPGETSSFTTIIAMTLVQAGLILYGAVAITFFGRRAGGSGNFGDALVLVTWIEFLLLLGQVGQFILILVVPQLSVLGAAALIALLFYMLTQFTAALHGFTSMGKVAFAVIAIFFGTAMVAGTVLVSLGFVPAQM